MIAEYQYEDRSDREDSCFAYLRGPHHQSRQQALVHRMHGQYGMRSGLLLRGR